MRDLNTLPMQLFRNPKCTPEGIEAKIVFLVPDDNPDRCVLHLSHVKHGSSLDPFKAMLFTSKQRPDKP
jgi:hypothetical protein